MISGQQRYFKQTIFKWFSLAETFNVKAAWELGLNLISTSHSKLKDYWPKNIRLSFDSLINWKLKSWPLLSIKKYLIDETRYKTVQSIYLVSNKLSDSDDIASYTWQVLVSFPCTINTVLFWRTHQKFAMLSSAALLKTKCGFKNSILTAHKIVH